MPGTGAGWVSGLSTPLAENLQRRGVPSLFTTGYSLKHRPLPGLEASVCVAKPCTAGRLREGRAATLQKKAPAKS